jgi:hypothetical protein
MTEPMSGRDHLHFLIGLFLANQITIPVFCRQFETSYNFHADRAALTEVESKAFRDLFDKVAWYSPFPEERKMVPSYLSETQIEEAIRLAASCLGSVPQSD